MLFGRLKAIRCIRLTCVRAALKHEKLYLDHLPAADRYNRSLMHRDTLVHVAVTRYDIRPAWAFAGGLRKRVSGS